MYQIKFTLKQHTPIIHFQHNQDGATLRASEVKPKLDRFVLTKLGEGNYENGRSEAQKNGWLIDKDKGALNYKMRIEAVSPVIYKIEQRENIGSFFGAMGKEYKSNPRGLSIVNNDISCIIISKDVNLTVEIGKVLNKFFALTNFGMRQSKGFGSFSVTTINNESQTFPTTEFDYSFNLGFDGKKIEKKVQVNLAEQIDIFYRSLRSGININSFYFKSALFCYLNKKSIQWDKKTIKANYFNNTDYNGTERKWNKITRQMEIQNISIKYLGSQQDQHKKDGVIPDILITPKTQTNDHQYKLYRDRLGFSSNEKWYSYRQNLSKTEAKKNGNSWQKKGKNECQIVRYKSPLFFKILIDEANKKAAVYFDIFEDKSIDNYVGKMFNIQLKPDTTKPRLTKPDNLFMPIANRQELDLKKFLIDTFSSMDVSKHINKIPPYKITNRQNKQEDNPLYIIYEDLKSIYSQLKTQLQNKQK